MRDAVIEGEDLAEKDGAIEKDKIKDNNGIGQDDAPSLFDECGEGHDHKTEQALDEDEDVVGFEAYAFFVRGRRGGGDDTHGGVKNREDQGNPEDGSDDALRLFVVDCIKAMRVRHSIAPSFPLSVCGTVMILHSCGGGVRKLNEICE